jgi:hypothetical protein
MLVNEESHLQGHLGIDVGVRLVILDPFPLITTDTKSALPIVRRLARSHELAVHSRQER